MKDILLILTLTSLAFQCISADQNPVMVSNSPVDDLRTSLSAKFLTEAAVEGEKCSKNNSSAKLLIYGNLRKKETSPEFHQKVKAYLEMHKACSRAECLQKPFPCFDSSGHACSYFLLRPVGGTGNTILSLVSSIAYSLLTNRTILVASGRVKLTLCDPVEHPGSWLFPELSAASQKELAAWEQYQHVNLNHKRVEHEWFYCEGRQHSLAASSKVVSVVTNQYFLPGLYLLPSFQASLRQWFPDGDAFRAIAKHFVFPSSHIAAEVQRRVSAHSDAVKIGFQVRSFKPIITERAFPCLVWVINKAMRIHAQSDKFVILMASSNAHHKDKLGLYLESPKFRQKLLRKTAHIELVYETPVHLSNFTAAGTDAQAQVEISILGQADFLVITPQSTFGSVAANLGNVETDLVDFTKSKGTCIRVTNLSPCFHFPPKVLSCSKKEQPTNWTMYESIMTPCKPPERGVRLRLLA